jgi:hypothetical protein
MMKTEYVHAFVEIQHPFGHVVETEEFRVTTINVIDCQVALLQLLIKGLAETRPNMQQSEKSRRVQATAMPQSPANDVVVVGSNGFQNVEHGDGVLQFRVGTTDEPRRVQKVPLNDALQSTFQFKGGALHQEFGGLMDNLECHLIRMKQRFRFLLQGKEFAGAQVALIVGGSLTGKDGFTQFFGFIHARFEFLWHHMGAPGNRITGEPFGVRLVAGAWTTPAPEQ